MRCIVRLQGDDHMYQAYKFRMYPTQSQKILIAKTFGSSRFIYNYFLEECKNYGYKKAYDMCAQLKELQKSYEWLKEVDSCSLRCAIFNLEDAFKNFFEKRSDYPVFKSKYQRQSYRTNCIKSSYKGKNYSNIWLDLNDKKVRLPKLGEIDIRGYRNLEVIDGKIINATVTKESNGKYYVSIILEKQELKKDKVKAKKIIGIDLGVKDLVITSDGEKYDNKKILLKQEKRLKQLQRKLSRQERNSKNYQKTRLKIGKLYHKIKNSRRCYINDITNKIVKENDIIVTEKLDVKTMSKNHRIAKYILDASFHRICELLKWKSMLQGKYYYQIDTYYPSSKTCSVCGEKTELTNQLNIRNWQCKKCGTEHDRDMNASINILLEGLKLHYGCRNIR